MATKDLVIRVAAVDNATKVVQKVQGSLNRTLGPMGRLSQRAATFGQTGSKALDKVNTGLQKTEKIARSVSDRIASIVPGLAALTGVLGGAGIATIAEKWGTLGFNLRNTSMQLGMSTQRLQAWHYAAQKAGVSAEQFDQSMTSSQNTIREAAFGANPQAMMLMQRLGIQISRGKDGQIDYEKTQRDVMSALGRIKNPAGQRTAADALGMGALLPMIQRGTFNQDRREAVERGYAPSEDAIARAAAFNDRLNDLRFGFEAMANTIGDKVVPVLEPMVRQFTTWLDDHRVDVANKLTDAVQKFSDWIEGVNWGDLYDKVNKIVDKFGGFVSVIEVLIGLKVAGTIFGWASAFGNLATKLGAAKAAAEGFKGVGGAAAIGEGAAGLGFLPMTAGAALGAGVLAAPVAYGASRIYHNMTETAGGIRQRIADRQARIDELDQLINLDSNNVNGVARYKAERASVQQSLDMYRARLKSIQSGEVNSLPLGIRSNNPLNLMPGGKQAYFATPEEGIAAAAENMRRNYSGLTIAQIVDKWTGGARTGNTPAQMGNYTRLLERGTGLLANQRPDLSDPQVMAALFKAQIRAENGQQPYTDDQIVNSVQAGLAGRQPGGVGAVDSASVGPGAVSQQDLVSSFRDAIKDTFKASVELTVKAPPGHQVEAKTDSGDYVPTRVNYAMGLGAMP